MIFVKLPQAVKSVCISSALALLGCSGGSGGMNPTGPVVQATATPVSTPSPAPTATPTPAQIRDDASLFQLVTRDDPFGAYRLFPNADEFATGRLNGSEAHRPVIRVSLNAIAFGALQNGRLPAGSRFPNGSIVFKAIGPSPGAAPMLYAVMRKDDGGSLSGSGWQWAEYFPDGAVAFSINSRGSVCTSCHMREQGPQNDLVRTFERQR